jgi:hypothetical protein
MGCGSAVGYSELQTKVSRSQAQSQAMEPYVLTPFNQHLLE